MQCTLHRPLEIGKPIAASLLRFSFYYCVCERMYVNHSFHTTSAELYPSRSHFCIFTRKKRKTKGAKSTVLIYVQLAIIIFRILHVFVPFCRAFFIVCLFPGGGRGVKDWRRARYVEFFNKNDASVCAKWYGLFFLISLRMRRGRDHLSFFFVFFFSFLSYAVL